MPPAGQAISFWTLFEAVADAVPDREAIVWCDQRLTYRDVADRARRFAHLLSTHGLGHQRPRATLHGWESGQDLVGLYLLNGPEYLIAGLGGYAARAAPFNVNYRYVADELQYLLSDSDPRAIVYHARFAPVLSGVVDRMTDPPLLLQVADESGCPLLPDALDLEAELDAISRPVVPDGHAPEDLYVLYTGGTTGMPKGTLWRQDDLFSSTLAAPGVAIEVDALVEHAVADGGSRRFVPSAPFMHGAAHWLAMSMLLTGGTVLINDIVDHLDPASTWRLVERERATWMLMVGEALARPLTAELEANEYDTSSVAVVMVGGAMTSPATKTRLLDQLGAGSLIVDAAGASETGGALRSISTSASTAEAAIFEAQPRVAVLDEQRSRLLEPGDEEIGWFAVRGAIPLGYLGDPRKTAETFPTICGVRWSIPGDRARLRADGTIELLGRDSVTINTGGEKVFAEEVEAAMLEHPAIADVIVVGRPSEQWGSEVVAVVQLDAASTAHEPSDDDLVQPATARLARYKLPKAIVRVPEIVRSPAGKADYRWARSVATAGGLSRGDALR